MDNNPHSSSSLISTQPWRGSRWLWERYYRQLLLLLLLLQPSTNLLADDGWQQVRDQDGIRVFLRSIPNSPIQEFKGVIRIQSSLDSLAGVMDDNQACREWVHQCENSAVLETLGFRERYVFQVNDFPFPAANRDIIMHALMEQNQTNGAITIRLTAVADYCSDKETAHCLNIATSNNVHITRSSGYYQLLPIEPGWVEVTWQQHIDPAGVIPEWMVNSMLMNVPFNTLKKLRQLVKSPKYQQAQLQYNDNGIATGFKVKNW